MNDTFLQEISEPTNEKSETLFLQEIKLPKHEKTSNNEIQKIDEQ
jgi:hypothetical protein